MKTQAEINASQLTDWGATHFCKEDVDLNVQYVTLAAGGSLSLNSKRPKLCLSSRAASFGGCTAAQLGCPISKAPSNMADKCREKQRLQQVDPSRPNLSQDSLYFSDGPFIKRGNDTSK